MTIKEIMQIGTSGMNSAQKYEEQERRLEVSNRLNVLHFRIEGCQKSVQECKKGSEAEKMLNSRIKQYKREMNRIKAAESEWLKQAAWFMYA